MNTKEIVHTLAAFKPNEGKLEDQERLFREIQKISWATYIIFQQRVDELESDDPFKGVYLTLVEVKEGLWGIGVEKEEASPNGDATQSP